jgi:hypothetical protein
MPAISLVIRPAQIRILIENAHEFRPQESHEDQAD